MLNHALALALLGFEALLTDRKKPRTLAIVQVAVIWGVL